MSGQYNYAYDDSNDGSSSHENDQNATGKSYLFEVLNSTLKSIKTSCTVEFHHIEFHYFFVVNKNKLF